MSGEGFGENTLEFGEEHVGESDRETTSIKRMKEIPIDWLSELPDSLLIHILSFLGVKQAGVTSVLSKRWKFLWAELPRLEFQESWENEKPLDFVSWVNRTLDIRKGSYLEKFLVSFTNCDEPFVSDVDAWVEFSVKNEVKQLILIFGSSDDDFYTSSPSQMIYSCSSLTFLHLTKCFMPSSETTIKWQSLTRLFLDQVELNQRLIDEILSSCPALTSLELEGCSGFYRLEVNSRCLNYLRVEDADYEPYLEISAPYVRNLDIMVVPQEGRWQLKNISSVLKASIDLWVVDGHFSEEGVMSNANEFLEKFKQVEKLDIRSLCFKVLVIMAKNGRQLPQFKLRHLTMTCWSQYEYTISAIICLLESSPNLETLFLQAHKTMGGIAELAPNAKNDLDGDLLHLKKIRINNFADPNGEPLLTLAQILLTRAPVLEDMVIEVADTSDFVNIAKTLLTYSRSSTKAKIHLSSRTPPFLP